MTSLWRKWAPRIDALTLRERVMVFVAAVAAAAFLIYALFVNPDMTRERAYLAQAAQQRTALATVQQQMQALEKKIADPDAANRVRRDEIRQEMVSINEQLKGMQQGLVPASSMKTLLQDMLARNPRLHLVALRTLPGTLLLEKSEKPAAPVARSEGERPADESGVYKHGIEITVAGSYADLYDYLARLERLSWRMFWSRALLNAQDYPRVTLTLTVYTLSLDKAWLEI
jgi:MSHA biogenesis protein MshJ